MKREEMMSDPTVWPPVFDAESAAGLAAGLGSVANDRKEDSIAPYRWSVSHTPQGLKWSLSISMFTLTLNIPKRSDKLSTRFMRVVDRVRGSL